MLQWSKLNNDSRHHVCVNGKTLAFVYDEKYWFFKAIALWQIPDADPF